MPSTKLDDLFWDIHGLMFDFDHSNWTANQCRNKLEELLKEHNVSFAQGPEQVLDT